jgi:outer membrane lipoprotein-sorting protein
MKVITPTARRLQPKFLVLFALAAALAGAIPARAASPELEKVLRQMDAASVRFQSAEADFKWEQYTTVVDSRDLQTGTVYFKRTGANTQMAAQIRQLNGRDDPKTLAYDGKGLQLYQPKIKQITQFSAGSNKGQYESFLTLGFGGSGKDLAANWDITFVGYETLKDGAQSVQTAHLDLVSKQASVRNMFSKVSIWVDPARGISLKQFFLEQDGSRTATYFNIHMNQPVDAAIKASTQIDPKTFKVKAAGVTIVNR